MRQKVTSARIGDFISKALNSFHFKVVSTDSELVSDAGRFFAPKFLYWMLGEEERILGYEGLQVVIYLSAKRLIPCVEVTFARKAPAMAKVDDVVEKLRKHYGTIYTDKKEFATKVLAYESQFQLPGVSFTNDKLQARGFQVRHVSLSDSRFSEQNFFV
jgi:hypothetical protein